MKLPVSGEKAAASCLFRKVIAMAIQRAGSTNSLEFFPDFSCWLFSPVFKAEGQELVPGLRGHDACVIGLGDKITAVFAGTGLSLRVDLRGVVEVDLSPAGGEVDPGVVAHHRHEELLKMEGKSGVRNQEFDSVEARASISFKILSQPIWRITFYFSIFALLGALFSSDHGLLRDLLRV